MASAGSSGLLDVYNMRTADSREAKDVIRRPTFAKSAKVVGHALYSPFLHISPMALGLSELSCSYLRVPPCS